ncbi:MAG: anthranilate synthase component I, partial [Planctomycetes bacterium]|nr:anthranilate synthase component I [Planctomycetota bacterium]
MLHFEPDTKTFQELCGRANAIPVYTSLLSDQLTPVSAFDRVASKARHAFLLESVVGGEKIARYSFLGADPVALIETRGNTVTKTTAEGTKTYTTEDPLKELETLLAGFKAAHPPRLPRFLGGAVGYAAYDIVRLYENLPSPPQDDRGLPDMQFGIYDQMVIFDHVSKLVHVVVHAHVEPGGDTDKAYEVACERIRVVANQLGEIRTDPIRPLVPAKPGDVKCESTFTREQFEAAVCRCKAYIVAGDAFQI